MKMVFSHVALFHTYKRYRPSEEDKTMERLKKKKKSMIARGWGRKKDKQVEHRGSLGQWKTILSDTTQVDTTHYIFVQTHRLHNTKSES